MWEEMRFVSLRELFGAIGYAQSIEGAGWEWPRVQRKNIYSLQLALLKLLSGKLG